MKGLLLYRTEKIKSLFWIICQGAQPSLRLGQLPDGRYRTPMYGLVAAGTVPARIRVRPEHEGALPQSPNPAPVTRSVQWYSVCPSITRAWERSKSILSKQSWA